MLNIPFHNMYCLLNLAARPRFKRNHQIIIIKPFRHVIKSRIRQLFIHVLKRRIDFNDKRLNEHFKYLPFLTFKNIIPYYKRKGNSLMLIL